MDARARLSLWLLLLAWCGSAQAQVEPDSAIMRGQLAQRGRIMPSGQLGGFWSNDAASSYGSYAEWTLYGSPAVTYFVRDNLGVGGGLDLGWSKGALYGGHFKRRELGLSFVLTWNVPISERWSLMLRPALGYAHEWADETVALVPETRVQAALGYLRFSTSLPFVYTLTSQLGLGFGPQLRVDYVVAHDYQSEIAFRPGLVGPVSSTGGTRLQLGLSVTLFASF